MWSPTTNSDTGWYRQGVVITPQGVVTYYTQQDATHGGYSTLQFVRYGRVHERRFDYSMTERATAVQAGKLARDITYRTPDDE